MKGLILLSASLPEREPPERPLPYQGPPKVLHRDFAMFLLSPFFGPTMSLPMRTVDSMMPMAERRLGVDLDARITNTDYEFNNAFYRLEDLEVPVLVINAADDRLIDPAVVRRNVDRIPGVEKCSFASGGHLLLGNEAQVQEAIEAFVDKHRVGRPGSR